MSDEKQYDVVVLGAGIAGLTAAVRSQENGLSVALVEKTPAIGGSSAMSGGYMAFSGTEEQAAHGVVDSEDLFLADMQVVGQHMSDEKLLRAYLDSQTDTYRWLKAKGFGFRVLERSAGQTVARSHLSQIKDIVRSLADEFVAGGGDLLLDHRAVELVREADSGGGGPRVTGVVVRGDDGERTLSARAGVVLATGGFSRSADLLRTFAPEQLAAIPYGGLGNTGDGLKMAWKLGAGLADMSYVSATYGSHPETTMEFHELLTAYYWGAIIVNTGGKRFVDESQSYKLLGMAVLTQDQGLGFQVFDSKVRAKSEPGVPLADIDMLEDIGHVFSASTLPELAEKAGIDPVGLRVTVDRYNAAIAAHGPDEQGRTGINSGVGDLLPIDAPPYYAYPAKALMTTTYCGVTVTPRSEVVDVDGDVIAGLYAIGEVTGGFHGAAYMTGTSLGKGAVFGSIVADVLAATVAVDANS